MISPYIHDARVELRGRKTWYVFHPSNDAVLARCDSREEAERYRDAINDLPRQLRGVGCEVSL